MRKLLLSIGLVGLATTASFAQKGPKNAIGLRFGANSGLGTEISYQRDLMRNNRLEVNLGFRDNHNYNTVKVTGLYEWVWNIEGNLNWFAGAGAAVGTYDYKYHDHGHRYKDDGTFGLLTGTVGLEYNLDIPLQIAIDARPELYLNNSYRDGLYLDLGIAVRYKF
ncbi:hypothetical protein [Myroides odoratus]|jgi:hypothetical protein|uniref:Outer membrane protein beta-barrel domain-containing protein n=1 Tax=Myroides odoratus TaxID=256 RepID=A0A9Q6Z3T9_MYROD|nr:hypothetical protein [Myroides odoratus]EHQ44324.1 secreted protein [Myroides odoratus DSM 2801]EKB04115.1 hypothetical protein HMPREF9716_03335 [Myroides odoratus CIP 103059]QQU01598.1 hypothetical protein I6I88_07645 [Myroides odoratus]WQD56122.1 hypothetical protein U0010_11340 [Myroides odoratus]STZ31663.1 Uncharacterised protein [Myroides odoratus]